MILRGPSQRGLSPQSLTQTLKTIDKLIQLYQVDPDPYRDRNFWSKKSSNEDPATCTSSVSSTQWRPKLRADRDMLNIAGDTSEGSTSVPRLECIDELAQLDEEVLREMQERVTPALARKGSSLCYL